MIAPYSARVAIARARMVLAEVVETGRVIKTRVGSIGVAWGFRAVVGATRVFRSVVGASVGPAWD